MGRETLINKLEKGRAEFAYRCAKEGIEIKEKKQIGNEFYEDDNYDSYVKKIPSMILSNGLGQTLAFIVAKRKKDNERGKAGSENNPKNAYDLIYKHLTDYLRSNSSVRITMPQERSDLLEWVISCDSAEYRHITQEVLAFLNWLKRFAEGMSEEETKGGEQ